MEEQVGHNQGGVPPNEIINTTRPLEGDVQALDIFAAVREVLQNILCQSKKVGVHLSVKSTKNCQNSERKSWFYIKVSTRARLDITILEDKIKNPALFMVLRYMQKCENESHLCIQSPRDSEGEGHSVQQNLILEGERLQVLHEVIRSKKANESTLHLRVQQPVWHMMKECSKIHAYMAQSRMFRPRADMSFTMKVGEAVSQTDFRVQNKQKITPTLPSIVSDAAFYIQECDQIVSSETVTTCAVDPVFINAHCLSQQNECRNVSVHVSTFASYIPLKDDTFSMLTLYGPGYLPLVSTTTLPLLEDIDWGRLGFTKEGHVQASSFKNLLPCHASVVLKPSRVGHDIGGFALPVCILLETLDTSDMVHGYQIIEKNIESLVKDHRQQLDGSLHAVIEKVLQPALNKAKNRSLVIKSISSICKAVTDVVSMSSNEQFRTSVLQCLKVTDTADIKAELNRQLTDLSHKKHPGVWAGSPRLKATGRNDFQGVFKDKGITQGQVVGTSCECTAEKEANLNETDNTFKSQTIQEEHSDGNYGNKNKSTVRNLQVCDNPVLKSTVAYPLSSSQPQSDIDNDSDANNEQTGNGAVTTVEKAGSRTPEISEVTKEMEKISPFQQLADNSPAMSMEMTPDVCRITQAMKDVSPFQELVNNDNMCSNSPQVTSEDPCGCQVVPEILHESLPIEEVPSVRYSLKTNSSVQIQHDKDSKLSYDKKEIIPTKLDEDSNNMFMNDYLTESVTESDFELLSSEEFGPTFEVVSDFVDEMESFQSSLSAVDLFSEFKDTPRNIEKSSCVHFSDKDKNNQNKESNGSKADFHKEESFILSESDYTKEKTNDDFVETAESEVKSEEKKSKDLDDWFNDVLMEVGEWLS